MCGFVIGSLFLVTSCGDTNDFQNKIISKTTEIKSQNTMTGINALESLRKLNSSGFFNADIFRQSVARVVFLRL